MMSTKVDILNSNKDYERIASCLFKNGVLLDTCVLLLLIVGLHNPSNIQKHPGLGKDYNKTHFNALQKTLGLAGQKIYSTSYIPPEISNLLINRDKIGHHNNYQYEYVGAMIEYFLDSNMTVLHDELDKILKHSELISLGVTDISILQIANDKDVVVITEDQKLYFQLHSIGRNAMLIRELKNFVSALNL